MKKITIPFLQNFCGKNPTYYIHCISVLALSVSADVKNVISVFYQYWPIRKLSVSGFIGISRYEKKLIGCTLRWSVPKCMQIMYFLPELFLPIIIISVHTSLTFFSGCHFCTDLAITLITLHTCHRLFSFNIDCPLA